MRPFFALLALTILVSTASSSQAQAQFMPAPIDVGDLTSDGAGGWNYLVRPLAPGERAPSTVQFVASPLDVILPPATPSQTTIDILSGQSLALVIPNTGSPMLELTDARDGSDINVTIFRTYGLETDSPFDILGFEYLHPLGTLAEGDYKLNLTFFTSSFGDSAPPQVSVGYIPFTVAAIPTPGTVSLMVPAIAVGLLAQRRLRLHRSGK